MRTQMRVRRAVQCSPAQQMRVTGQWLRATLTLALTLTRTLTLTLALTLTRTLALTLTLETCTLFGVGESNDDTEEFSMSRSARRVHLSKITATVLLTCFL